MHSILEQRISAGTLPSTLLFIGPRERVNLDLAKEFVKRLLGPTPKIDSGNHPDVHFYKPEEKSALHSITALRTLIAEMALPPFESPRKIFIIDEAEKMLPSSSNLLLKTLEEPPSDAVILLLTSQPEALLPTIRSRATPFSFEPVANHVSSAVVLTLLELALAKDYASLLQTLDTHQEQLDELSIEELLEPLFAAAAKRPFKKIASLLEEARLADQHNVKRRTLLLNFLICL